jgi:TRAP transporter TAXI family solute receptor
MRDDHTTRRRRSFLKAITAAGAVGLAGCSGGDGGDGNGDGGGDAGNASGGNDTGNDSGGSGGEGAVEWTIGTSTPETATHASGVAMSQVVSEQSERISMSAQTTGGTAANPRLIANGDIDVAQSTAWAVARSNTGGPPYGEPVGKTMTQVLPFMTLEYYLIRRDVDELSDIDTVSDIPTDGSISMAFGQRGGTNYFAGLDGFRMSGVENPEDNYDIRSMSFGDQGSALRDGRLDIGIVYGVSREVLTGWAQEVGATTDVSVVEWEFDQSTVEESGLPYVYIESPADLWEQDLAVDSIPSVGVGYESVFPADVSTELGYEFTSVVLENVDAVREASSVLSRAGPEFASEFLLRSGDAPVHPGAEQYYRENDLWDDALTSLEDYES